MRLPLALFAIALAAQQAGQVPATALVTGRVIDASGAPIATAIVSANGAGLAAAAQPARVLTDSDGRYFFNNLAVGSYTITATKPGWLAGGFGKLWWGGATVPVELTANERRGNVDLTLWKNAVISGRIVDEAGEPMVHVDVRVVQTRFVAGRRQSSFGARALTDDRGIFRFSSLTPGDYLIVVPVGVLSQPSTFGSVFDQSFLQTMTTIGAAPLQIEQATVPAGGGKSLFTSLLSMPVAPPADGVWQTYATTFYPSTTTVGSATVVRVNAGEERDGLTVVMRPTSTVAVSGQVVAAEGTAAGYAVHLVPADGADAPLFDAATAVTDGRGDFTFLGVPSGRYVARVVRVPWPAQEGWRLGIGSAGGNTPKSIFMSSSGPRGPNAPPPALPTDPLLYAEQTVVVGDRAVKDVRLTLRAGFRVSGRVDFDGNTAPKPASMDLRNTAIQIEPANGQTYITILAGQFSEDGRFTTQSMWPGRYLVRVPSAPRGWTFTSATYRGRDISETPMDITGDLEDVVITFTDHPNAVEGTVTGEAGQSVNGSTVLLFPVEPATWTDFGRSSRRVTRAAVSARGSFRFVATPPGDYFIVAISDRQAIDAQDPAFLAKVAAFADRIQVRDGQPVSHPLTLKDVR